MTPAEVAALLTAAKSLDDRVTPDKPRVAGWSAALDPDLALADARAFLVEHYRVEVRPIMPADVNLRWRAVRRARAEAETARRALELPADAVPMPPDIRERVRALAQRSAMIGRQ